MLRTILEALCGAGRARIEPADPQLKDMVAAMNFKAEAERLKNIALMTTTEAMELLRAGMRVDNSAVSAATARHLDMLVDEGLLVRLNICAWRRVPGAML
jgi:hypothetical protein